MSNGKKKSTYREGTVNGVKFSESRRLTKRERQEQEYKSLVKMLTSCICILIMVFVLNWIITSNFTFNGIYYEEPEGNEVIEIVSSSNDEEPAERVNLHLNGKLTIKVEVGDKYVEPGYTATSDLKGDISDNVVVSGKVDTSKVGTYEITYTLSYRGIKPKLTRLVKVVEKKNEVIKEESEESNSSTSSESNNSSGTSSSEGSNNLSGSNSSGSSNSTGGGSSANVGGNSSTSGGSSSGGNTGGTSVSVKPQGNITLKLNGNATVYVAEGSSYSDAGATAIDNNGNDVSSKITVSGSVNPNVVGTYKITYNIQNYNGEVLTVVRNVIVQAMEISLKLDNSAPTNKAINILVTTNVDNFDRLMLPNGTKVPNKSYTYKVTTNGTYEFIVFNTAGVSRKATMIVSNIDKDKPKGKCEITYGERESYITISAKDASGIDRYVYSNTEYSSNVITINRRLTTNVQINVGFYDKAGNYGNANCLAP